MNHGWPPTHPDESGVEGLFAESTSRSFALCKSLPRRLRNPASVEKSRERLCSPTPDRGGCHRSFANTKRPRKANPNRAWESARDKPTHHQSRTPLGSDLRERQSAGKIPPIPDGPDHLCPT